MQILKAGVLYFALVLGAGFVLGTLRALWIVPSLSARSTELMETPIMLGVTILAARWAAPLLSLPPKGGTRLGVGFIAFGFMLGVESALGCSGGPPWASKRRR